VDQTFLLDEHSVDQLPLKDVLRCFDARSRETVRAPAAVRQIPSEPHDRSPVFFRVNFFVSAVCQVSPDKRDRMRSDVLHTGDEIDYPVHLFLILGAENGVDAEFKMRIASQKRLEHVVGLDSFIKTPRRSAYGVMVFADPVKGYFYGDDAVSSFLKNPLGRSLNHGREHSVRR
jgi:hypothetical protein